MGSPGHADGQEVPAPSRESMTVERPPEKFDCLRFVREARARIHEEPKHMSAEEFV